MPNDFVLGAVASCIAATFTNPWEVVKTRLQLQHELCRTTKTTVSIYQSAFQSFQLIYQREGLKGLQRGLTSAYLYQMVMNGTRLGCYDPFQQYFNSFFHQSWLSSMLSGFSCGLLGAYLASPLYLIKSRMQAYSSDPILSQVGTQRKYRHVLDAFQSILHQQGMKGLWKGVSGSMLRTGGSTVQLSSYDALKNYCIDPTSDPSKNQIKAHLQASLITGGLVTLFMNPFDVVTTRLYNQTYSNGQPLYTGPLNAFFKILKYEGVAGLYKGVVAHWFRVGPHNVLTFVFLEQLRYLSQSFSNSTSLIENPL